MAEATQFYKPSAYKLFSQGKTFTEVYEQLPISRATAYRWWKRWIKEKVSETPIVTH
jgi:transposase